MFFRELALALKIIGCLQNRCERDILPVDIALEKMDGRLVNQCFISINHARINQLNVGEKNIDNPLNGIGHMGHSYREHDILHHTEE